MGVKQKHFVKWLELTFKRCVRPVGLTDHATFHTVCIDVNPLIHTCMRKAKSEAKFVKALFADLDRCLSFAAPRAIVYLAVDGSPPLAKMKEQIRRRRAKSLVSKKTVLDLSCITPGTTFMIRLTEYLHYYSRRFLSKKSSPRNLQFIVDGAETAGEGEAKIMLFLAQNAASLQNKRTAVLSGDSDVIIQSLLSHVQHIFVVRLSPEDNSAVSIHNLREQICAQCGHITKHDSPDYRRKTIVDFCVMVMFSGNDYMRKLSGAQIASIWPIYRKLRSEAIADGEWFGRSLMTNLDEIDLGFLEELLIRFRRLTHRAEFQPNMGITLSMLGLSVATEPITDDNDEEMDSEEDEEDDEPILVRQEEKLPIYTKHIPNYLQSLLWVLSMYSSGICPNAHFTQVGEYLTIEQILTAISRDLAHSKPIATPYESASTSLMTILSTITLLGNNKVDLIPVPWRITFLSPDIRLLCQSMVYDSSLINESFRIQELISRIGKIMVPLIDSSSSVVRLLLYRQAPVIICTTDEKLGQVADTPQQFGARDPGTWDGIEVKLSGLRATHPTTAAEFNTDAPVYLSGASLQNQQDLLSWPFRPRKVRSANVAPSPVSKKPQKTAIKSLNQSVSSSRTSNDALLSETPKTVVKQAKAKPLVVLKNPRSADTSQKLEPKIQAAPDAERRRAQNSNDHNVIASASLAHERNSNPTASRKSRARGRKNVSELPKSSSSKKAEMT